MFRTLKRAIATSNLQAKWCRDKSPGEGGGGRQESWVVNALTSDGLKTALKALENVEEKYTLCEGTGAHDHIQSWRDIIIYFHILMYAHIVYWMKLINYVHVCIYTDEQLVFCSQTDAKKLGIIFNHWSSELVITEILVAQC